MNIILPDNTGCSIDPAPRTVEQVLREFGINPEEVIVSTNGRLVPEDAIVSGDDVIRVVRVAHGG